MHTCRFRLTEEKCFSNFSKTAGTTWNIDASSTHHTARTQQEHWSLLKAGLILLFPSSRSVLRSTRNTWGPPGTHEDHQEHMRSTRNTWGPPGTHEDRWVHDSPASLLGAHEATLPCVPCRGTVGCREAVKRLFFLMESGAVLLAPQNRTGATLHHFQQTSRRTMTAERHRRAGLTEYCPLWIW